MRVAELRDLLATLPDDDLVYLGSNHVRLVSRQHARTFPLLANESHACPECGTSHRRLVPHGVAEVPAGVSLYGERVGDWNGDPPPQVEYRGRWTKAARAAIDAHTEEPDR